MFFTSMNHYIIECPPRDRTSTVITFQRMLHASLNDTGVQLYQQMQARLKMLPTSTVCLISRTPDQDSFPKSSIMKGIMMREVLQDDNNYEDNCCDNDEGQR